MKTNAAHHLVGLQERYPKGISQISNSVADRICSLTLNVYHHMILISKFELNLKMSCKSPCMRSSTLLLSISILHVILIKSRTYHMH